MEPHKHAAVIKAWADGEVIEFKSKHDGEWVVTPRPTWLSIYEFRIRKEPKPDIVKCVCLEWVEGLVNLMHPNDGPINLILSFDGETEKLKYAEVISS